jgi:LytS/YehU family sensor histidine kinase
LGEVPLSTLADVLMLIYIVCAAGVHVTLARRGSRTARALLWANLPYILAVTIQTLAYLNVPLGLDTFDVARSTQWAMALQIVLFSFIIGDRIRTVRRAKETAEAEARVAEAEMQRRTEHFEKEAARLEIQALRSQMNPHFIFNALNSIQAFVERNDADKAGVFLGRFARLMRLVLENSRHAEVPLRSDLEALELYLSLEQARTGDRFDYGIHVDPALDQDLVLVPPLVAQPFVENAIWHGMAGRADRGRITLHVSNFGDDLQIIVEDDGQGRAAAGERRRTTGMDDPALVKKTSLGTVITRARLDLVGRQKGRPAGFTYIDMPQGTRVVLTLPMSVDV